MTARVLLFLPALLLTGCASPRPTDEFGICLAGTEDLAALKAVVTQVGAHYRSTVNDYSKQASRDLKALDSPIATEHLFALLVEDTRWRSKAGLVMINNIGTASAKSVGVYMFRNKDLLGSDSNTENLRGDLISAASGSWKIIDAPSSDGTYHECGE